MDETRLSPVEAAILVLISRGVSKPEAIAEVLRLSPEEVKRVIEDLKAKGLVEEVEKRVLFVKKRVLRLTRKGFDALPEALETLRSIAEKARRAYEAMRRHREAVSNEGVVVAPYYDLSDILLAEELLVLPALVMLGMLPAMFLIDVGAAGTHSHGGHG